MEVSNFKVEIVEGGQIGVSTKIRISADVKVETINEGTSNHSWAVSQAYVKYWVLNDAFAIVGRGKDQDYVKDYSREPGAEAILNWPVNIEYIWIPETTGTYYVPCKVFMKSNKTTDSWPPVWISGRTVEQLYNTVEISEPELQVLDEEDFLVTIGLNTQGYAFDGLVLLEDVDQTGLADGHNIRIVIPSGTIILGAEGIEVDGDGQISPQAIFSNKPDVYINGVLM